MRFVLPLSPLSLALAFAAFRFADATDDVTHYSFRRVSRQACCVRVVSICVRLVVRVCEATTLRVGFAFEKFARAGAS